MKGIRLHVFVLAVGIVLVRAAPVPERFETIQMTWERFRTTLSPITWSILSDEVITSHTNPRQKLRRVEIRFTSQTAGQWERRMDHSAIVHMPADSGINQAPERRGKVVIVASAYGDMSIEDNYGEPIAALTGYPTMVLPNPGEYDGHNGESCWVYFLRALLQDTQDPINHQYFRFAVPYLRALDVLEDFLQEVRIRAVIGGHSKRAPAAFNAAAMDPERIAGVVYMGMESTFSGYEGKAWQGISPVHSQGFVSCPVLYIGATNEDGYEMFNISRLQKQMKTPWTIQYIPNYRHASNSEIQILNWRMWVSHIFDGRPLSRISGLEWEENAAGTVFRVDISTPNKIIQAKVWYVYCDDIPYWRDLMWYPAILEKSSNRYEVFVSGKLPDAWFVEVKDIALGRIGYQTTTPIDITGKPTAERYSRGWKPRNWQPKINNNGARS